MNAHHMIQLHVTTQHIKYCIATYGSCTPQYIVHLHITSLIQLTGHTLILTSSTHKYLLQVHRVIINEKNDAEMYSYAHAIIYKLPLYNSQ